MIEAVLHEAAFALHKGDIKTYVNCDRRFHSAVAKHSGNGALVETVARLDLQIQLCGKIGPDSIDFVERAVDAYDDILQAFKSRDAPRAAFLMRIHLGRAQETVLARF